MKVEKLVEIIGSETIWLLCSGESGTERTGFRKGRTEIKKLQRSLPLFLLIGPQRRNTGAGKNVFSFR